MNAAEARNRSYRVREAIADALGKARHHDFSCGAGFRVTLLDGRKALLLSTSNAGFRGIEGHFDAEPGAGHSFVASLGQVARLGWESGRRDAWAAQATRRSIARTR